MLTTLQMARAEGAAGTVAEPAAGQGRQRCPSTLVTT
jgi:hypothetical protein